MRFLEFAHGPSIVITNEEQDLLKIISNHTTVNKKQLSERQRVIADQLVNKNLIIRKVLDDEINYKISANARAKETT
jgi:hypothetical protein